MIFLKKVLSIPTPSYFLQQHENVDDIWDDSALIEHYERSIQITYEAAKKMTQAQSSSSTKMDDENVKHEKVKLFDFYD
jgi:hypothetical protein